MTWKKKQIVGLVFCLSAIATAAGGWAWARSSERTTTDNAYVRGNTTAIASKVTGYVTVVDVADNQTVRANDVLFRIDDRDFHARLAQAEANVQAAQAHTDNVEAEIQLQHILVKQATAQKRAAEADLALAVKASQRQRELVRTNSVSRAQVDESDAARSKAEAGLLGAEAALEAQETRIKVLTTQRKLPWLLCFKPGLRVTWPELISTIQSSVLPLMVLLVTVRFASDAWYPRSFLDRSGANQGRLDCRKFQGDTD